MILNSKLNLIKTELRMLFTKLFRNKISNYPLVNLPIRYSYLNPQILSENTKEQWLEYKNWFFDVKSHRIKCLEKEVRSNQHFSEWNTDYTEQSISSLSEWFAVSVKTRRPTKDEIRWILENIPSGPGRERSLQFRLDPKTDSLCFDIGMYVGDTLISLNPKLRWRQLGGRQVWAGMIAITGELRHNPAFKPQMNFPTEPVSVVRVAATRIATEKETSRILLDAFEKVLSTYEPYQR